MVYVSVSVYTPGVAPVLVWGKARPIITRFCVDPVALENVKLVNSAAALAQYEESNALPADVVVLLLPTATLFA